MKDITKTYDERYMDACEEASRIAWQEFKLQKVKYNEPYTFSVDGFKFKTTFDGIVFGQSCLTAESNL